MSGRSKDVARKVPCTVCGRVVGATGLGRHMRAHRDAGSVDAGVAHLERLAGVKAPVEAELSTMEVCLAVLSKVAGPSVRVTDLPDVVEWMQSTHRLIETLRR
jgi:hypothetical protein